MAPNGTYKSRKCRYCRERVMDDNGTEREREVLWPPHDDYALCPLCREETVLSVTMMTRVWQAAEEDRRRFAFDWYILDSWLTPSTTTSTSATEHS